MTLDSEQKQYTACPVCSSPIKTWRVKRVGNNEYNIDLCGSCGYSFVNPRPSMQFLMDYYASCGHGHFENGGELPSYGSVLAQEQNDPNSILDAMRSINTIKSLNKNGTNNKFLDVGCGYGFFSKEALNAGFDVVALELAENEREIARMMTGLSPAASSFEKFECDPESLGVVFMSQILEHALDVNLWIKKSRDCLANDGILAIALPNYGSIFRMIMQEHDPYICPPAHLNFFNPYSLTKLLENHGFKIETIQWISRIPKRAFEKRLPRFGKPLLPVINVASSASLMIIDALRLGMMINVYSRKVNI